MQLYYYAGFEGVSNFGDELNPLIWQKYLPAIFDDDGGEIFVGIGTLINDKLPKATHTVIMGSGVGYGALPSPSEISKWEIYCVRGKLSAQKLGISGALVATDPAILMGEMYTQMRTKKYKYAYMPHWMNMGSGWREVCENLGFKLLDPLGSIEDIVRGMQESEVIITEAMHGAIVADALRIPWVSVHSQFGDYLPFKWQDWCSSLNIDYKSQAILRLWHPEDISDLNGVRGVIKKSLSPVRKIYIENRLKRISQVSSPVLSDDVSFKLATTRVLEAIDKFKCR